jgi:hypothetical protein
LLLGAVLAAAVAEAAGLLVGLVLGEAVNTAVTGSTLVEELGAAATVAAIDDVGLAGWAL